jgi:hypothetical protein
MGTGTGWAQAQARSTGTGTGTGTGHKHGGHRHGHRHGRAQAPGLGTGTDIRHKHTHRHRHRHRHTHRLDAWAQAQAQAHRLERWAGAQAEAQTGAQTQASCNRLVSDLSCRGAHHSISHLSYTNSQVSFFISPIDSHLRMSALNSYLTYTNCHLRASIQLSSDISHIPTLILISYIPTVD